MGDMQSLVQKILSDGNFRQQLSSNPETALKSHGFTPTPELLKTFKGLDDSALRELASNYRENKAAC